MVGTATIPQRSMLTTRKADEGTKAIVVKPVSYLSESPLTTRIG
jgi:hypothetical protein